MSPGGMADERPRLETESATNRRRVLIAAGSAGVSLLLAGCGESGPGINDTATGTPTMGDPTATETETPTEVEPAHVRAAHLSPDAPNVDVYVDDSAVLEDVPFGTVSDYLELAPDDYAVKITATGDEETVVFEGNVIVAAATAYTVAAIGELSDDADQSFEVVVLTDDNDPPGDETARLRAVHASPDAPAVDITVGETVLFDGVAFGGSGYTEVPAGEYTVEIRADTETNDGDVVTTVDVALAGGTVYSAFATGYLTPDDEPADTPFEVLLTEDATNGMG